jgi:hypothetical protein
MKRETDLLIWALVVALAFLSVTAPLYAQNKQSQTDPLLSPDILGPQLIVWSQLQSPQPLQRTRASQQMESAAQTFNGKIVRDGSTYVLKVSTTIVYPLAEQQKAKPYEGKQVRIKGILDANGESVHILSIEPVS